MFKAFPKVKFLWGVPGLQWPLFMRSCPRKEQRRTSNGVYGKPRLSDAHQEPSKAADEVLTAKEFDTGSDQAVLDH